MGSITTSFMTNGCSRTNTCVQPSASKPWPRAPSAADSLWSPKSDADPSWTYQALVSELPKERSTCSSLGHRRPEVCQQENSWVRSTIRPEAGIQPAFGDQATPTFEDSVHVEGQESFFLPPELGSEDDESLEAFASLPRLLDLAQKAAERCAEALQSRTELDCTRSEQEEIDMTMSVQIDAASAEVQRVLDLAEKVAQSTNRDVGTCSVTAPPLLPLQQTGNLTSLAADDVRAFIAMQSRLARADIARLVEKVGSPDVTSEHIDAASAEVLRLLEMAEQVTQQEHLPSDMDALDACCSDFSELETGTQSTELPLVAVDTWTSQPLRGGPMSFQPGDMVLFSLGQDQRHRPGVITRVGEKCTVVVLDETRSIGLGECWPELKDLVLENSNWRLGNRVSISGLVGRTRDLNGMHGTIIAHPREGHPTFVSKPSARPRLTFCIRFDGSGTALLEPRFLTLDQLSCAVEDPQGSADVV